MERYVASILPLVRWCVRKRGDKSEVMLVLGELETWLNDVFA